MALETFEFPDGSRYELDLSNPAHRDWMQAKAKAVPAAPSNTPSAPQPKENTVGRQLGLTVRVGAKGLASLPGLLVDPITALANQATGAKIPTTASAVDTVLSDLGVPKPENAGERVVGDMASSLAGTGGLVKGAEVAAKGVSPAIAAVLAKLQEAPKIQAAASALSGGAASAAQEMGGGPGAQIAAALAGGAIPGVAAGVAEPVRRVGANLMAPYSQGGRDAVKSRLLKDLVGDKVDDVSQALGNNPPKVQGMAYNAAQAAEPAGSTEFSALQRALDARFLPTQAREQATGNADARARLIGKIAGSPDDLEWAKSLRSDTAAATYGEAFKARTKGNPELAKIFQNPFVRQAYKDAEDVIQADKLSVKDNLTEVLQKVKLSLDDMIAGTSKTAIGTNEKRAALQAQKELVSWLERNNPKFAVARENFAQQSRPINRMEVGQELLAKLQAPLDDAERAGVFAGAVRDAPRTIKSATGNPRYKELAEVLLPKQARDVENVQTELARLRNVGQMASAGESRVRETLGETFQPIRAPNLLNRGVTVLRTVMDRMQHGTSEKTLKELATDMQSPERARQLLQGIPAADIEALSLVLQRMGRGTALGSATGVSATKE